MENDHLLLDFLDELPKLEDYETTNFMIDDSYFEQCLQLDTFLEQDQWLLQYHDDQPQQDYNHFLNQCLQQLDFSDQIGPNISQQQIIHDPHQYSFDQCLFHTNIPDLSDQSPHISEPQITDPLIVPDDFFNDFMIKVDIDFETWFKSNLSILADNACSEEAPSLPDVGNTTQIDAMSSSINTVNHVMMEESTTALASYHDHEHHSRMKRRSKSKPKSSGLELDEIQQYFHFPIVRAAKELRVGVTVLKKRCRELNIARWPHRKIKSLKCLIDNVKELGMTDANEIEMLEDHKKALEKVPGLSLTMRTKKLRQACFKANYKRRRLLNTSSPPFDLLTA